MTRKLLRTRKDNVLAGVCGGIARYFNIDVVIVRIIWVISALMGGFGIGTYIICAIIIPKEKASDQQSFDEFDSAEKSEFEYDDEKDYYFEEEKNDRTKQYLGLAFIVMGAIMTFKIMFPNFTFRFFWPVLLIGGGILLLNRHNNNDEEDE